MSKVGRSSYVEHARQTIIGSTPGKHATYKAREKNKAIDKVLAKQRLTWDCSIPRPMVVIMAHTGLVLELPAEAGRVLLRRRLCSITEREVSVDAVLEGDLETVLEAMDL